MRAVLKLNGYNLYHSFLSGYEQIVREKNNINTINVFPVADGDTGNNMVSTLQTSVRIRKVTRSVSQTMNDIADQALAGARGNSGIILAQFLNGLALACDRKDTLTASEFGAALTYASDLTWHAIDDPREGTILTVFKLWSKEMHELSTHIHDFRELFLKSMDQARSALRETTHQMEILRKANVVDAGAQGFVSFLEGIAEMLHTGKVPKIQADDILFSDEPHGSYDLPDSCDTILYRFCTEILINHRDYDFEELHAPLSSYGDSLIISRGRTRTRIHIHTNDPAQVFLTVKNFGSIIDQKIDDMILQHDVVHKPLSSTAIVTDSIADIPHSLLDRYQIHVISQKILWGKDEFLDRLTIIGSTFYPFLDQRTDYPGSSAPEPKRVAQYFTWLTSQYQSILVIPVSRQMSATWKVMESEAAKLRKNGYPITVVDSRLNSAAQGLVVIEAAKDAAAHLPPDEIIARTEHRIHRTAIYVSVATFKYMIRGGRIGKLKGLIGTISQLKPIISIDDEGKGIAYSASFSAKGSRTKIMKHLLAQKDNIERYAVVHAASADIALRYADELTQDLGKAPDYIMEISPAVGIHAGIGAVAVACMYKEKLIP